MWATYDVCSHCYCQDLCSHLFDFHFCQVSFKLKETFFYFTRLKSISPCRSFLTLKNNVFLLPVLSQCPCQTVIDFNLKLSVVVSAIHQKPDWIIQLFSSGPRPRITDVLHFMFKRALISLVMTLFFFSFEFTPMEHCWSGVTFMLTERICLVDAKDRHTFTTSTVTCRPLSCGSC